MSHVWTWYDQTSVPVFPWEKLLNPILNQNNQVKLLNETILNIMKNFVPSSSITSNLNESEWITRDIKKMLKKQNILYRNHRLNGFKVEDKIMVVGQRDDCYQAIKISKDNYLKSLGDKLINKTTGPKTYWKVINNLLNKCKIPRISPLLVAEKIITDCKENVKLFNAYFLLQRKPIYITIVYYPSFIRLRKQILPTFQ